MTDTTDIKVVKLLDETVSVTVSDTGLKGRPGIVWREEWSSSLDYYVGDVVKYNGTAFICTEFITANASAFPTVTANWSVFAEKGDTGRQNVTVSPSAPYGSCSLDSFTTQSDCLANGAEWRDPQTGDLWFDTSVGRLYALVEDVQGDSSWLDISGVVGTMSADQITVQADGELPSGNLQDILKRLEDQIFTSASTPTGSTTDEGDLWYDTVNDQMKVLRNGNWEVLVQTGATAAGYDDINLNGGYF